MDVPFDLSCVNVIFLKTLNFLKTNKRFLSFTNFGENNRKENKLLFSFFSGRCTANHPCFILIMNSQFTFPWVYVYLLDIYVGEIFLKRF